MDGVPLEICTFSFENDPDRCEDQFQREIVDCWRAVFQSNKNPILLTLSRTCCVRNSCVGALWMKYAYVLLPKKPLSRGTTSHRQELLAVSVGEAERLTVDELVARVRDTYGHSVLHGQRLRHGGSGRDGTISAGECTLATTYCAAARDRPVRERLGRYFMYRSRNIHRYMKY